MKPPPATHPALRGLAEPRPDDVCNVCLRNRSQISGELAWIFHRWVCRDRVDCYKHWKVPVQ